MRTVILKVTHLCNLGCKYCCVGDDIDNQVISEQSLDSLFSKLAEDDDESTIIFHGGEPLCVGLGFYKLVLKLQAKHPSHRYHNSLQTNGSLLNDEWIEFFKKNDFHLGFSIDGCKLTHDLNRPYKTGKSSFDDTFYWFLRARSKGMKVGAICVINSNTSKHIDEIYHFAKKYQISFKFNPQYPAGRAAINTDLGLDNHDLATAYIQLFDLWFADTPSERPNIRIFDYFSSGLSAITNGSDNTFGFDCSYANRCQYSFIGIAPNGDMFPCGKFVGDNSFKYGNINEEFTLKDILSIDVIKPFVQRHENGIKECEGCRYKSLCSGGCPHTSYLMSGSILAKNPFCAFIKELLSHIESRLKEKSVLEDVFVLKPIQQINENIVYSPLRNGAFLADDFSVCQLNKYLEKGDVSHVKNEQLLKHLFKWQEKIPYAPISYDINTTDTIVLLLTNKCNLHCSYCYSLAQRQKRNTISKSDLFSVINYVLSNHKLRQKTFSFVGGGEPTIEWELFTDSVELIRSNERVEHSIELTTNGTLLDNERVKWLRNKKVKVNISFEILPDIQQFRSYINGDNSFEKVDSALKLLIRNEVPTIIRSTITPHCVKQMEKMVEYTHVNYPGVMRLHFEPVMDNALDYNVFLNAYTDSFIKAYVLGQKYGVFVYNMITLTLSSLRSRFCVGEFCVTPDRKFVACQRVSSAHDSYEKYSYGEIKDNKVIFDGNKLCDIRNSLEQKEETCSLCFAKYHCAGMCPALKENLSNENRQAYCDFTKKLLQNMLYLQIKNSIN